MQLAAVHHIEQGSEHSCVAACVGMILLARGESYDEAALMAFATDAGLSMALAARALQVDFRPFLPIEALLAALERCRDGAHVLIIKVSGPRYVRCCGDRPGGAPSRFGALADPGDFGGPMHALLLVGVDDEAVRYLDPYFPRDGQPLTMSRDHLVTMYAGVAIEVPS